MLVFIHVSHYVMNVFSNTISYNEIKSFLIPVIIEKMLILELDAHY